MLGTLTGTIKEKSDSQIIFNSGSIGFELQVPNSGTLQKDQKITLFTYLHWNQDNGPSLFGFLTHEEKKIFQLIISCSGLGPKIGIAILEQLGAQSFLHAVESGNDKELSKVNGIGAKKAEQMIVQLKHKVAKLIKSGITIKGSTALQHWQNVSDVLKSLHYSQGEIQATMQYLRDQKLESPAFDQLMRQALAFLSKKA